MYLVDIEVEYYLISDLFCTFCWHYSFFLFVSGIAQNVVTVTVTVTEALVLYGMYGIFHDIVV